MRKFLLSLLALFVCAGAISAKQAVFDFVNEDYGLERKSTTYIESGTKIKSGDVEATLSKKASSNGFRLWTDGLRFYKSSDAGIVLNAGGATITKVEVVYLTGASFALSTATPGGEYAEAAVDSKTGKGTWTGSLSELRLDYTANDNKAVQSITITYDGDGGTVTPDPDPEPEPDPDPEIKEAKTLAEFISMTPAKDDAATMAGELTVVYVNGSYVYVKDATASSLIYKYGLGYNAGDVIPGGWEGKNAIYSGLYEIVPTGAMPAASGTVEVVYPEHEGEITEAMVNSVVTLRNVTFTSATPATKTNFNVTYNGKTYTFRNNFTLASVPANDYDVVAAVAINTYNNKTSIQIYPIEYKLVGEDKETVEAPVFSVESGNVAEGTTVTLTTATDGADIFYTTDGSVPTDESLIYLSPIAINADVTIKAIAVKAGMYDSPVVTAEYTVIREGEMSATFDFTEVTGLTPSYDPDSEDALVDNGNKYFDITDVTFTSGDAVFKAGYINAEDKGTSPRLYIRTSDQQLRIYKKSQFSVSVPEGFKLSTVVLNYNNTEYVPLADGEAGTVTTASKKVTWKAGDNNVAQVIFASLTGKTSQINSIDVTYVEDMAGIDGIATDEAAGGIEYFNLQGIRVDGGNLVPGIYVRRQGNNVSKVLVK